MGISAPGYFRGINLVWGVSKFEFSEEDLSKMKRLKIILNRDFRGVRVAN